ncbi:relaxase/mobilization nuclease domain-containing protein [Bdellovibrionota bacterium FG-2]
MATVKILFVQDATRVEKYLRSNEREANPQTEQGVHLKSMRKDYVATQEKMRSAGNEIIHIIQSFSPEESKRLTPEQVHGMGEELISRFAPQHQYVVQTHTDTPHLHNHIALNPVSLATGERIQNKKCHLQTLRDLSDEICLSHGLSVLPKGAQHRRTGLSDKVQRIDRMRGRSYIVDMANKANFASRHATGYDEYLAILNAFDVQVRIEPQNITYYYPDKTHGKRGRNLDPQLDKPALERKFESNRARVAASPELRATLSDLIADYRTPPHALTSPEQDTPQASPLVSTRAEGVSHPREDELAKSVIPIEEIQRAKMQSILGYCERTKIGLSRTEDGRTVLRGRDYVEVSEYTWTNHRNKTRGNAIDFVASHREVGFLHAVSILNNNPKLMLLEQHMGEEKRGYQSFYIPRGYIPKGDPTTRADSIAHLSRWLGHSPSHRVHGELLKRQRVNVGRDGVIHLFSADTNEGALDFIPQDDGRYKTRRQGKAEGDFFASHPKKARELHLYLEPEAFLKGSPNLYIDPEATNAAQLVLLAPSLKPVHQAIARHRELERVIVINSAGQSQTHAPDILQFFDSLRDSLNPFHIEVSLTWEPPTPAPHERSLSRDMGLEREIHFP